MLKPKLAKYLAENTALVARGQGRLLRPLVAQSTRALLAKIVEDYTPTEGLYYCVRNPDGWAPFSYRFDEYPETDHVPFWEEYVAPVLATRWAVKLKSPAARIETLLSQMPYAFPRGRVVKMDNGRYVVYHGNDMPKSVSRQSINTLFSLGNNATWENDFHERCQADERDRIRQLLKLPEKWPAVSAEAAFA